MTQVLIVHGWSDTSETFDPLARFLRDNGYDAAPLFLGDYISLDDDVRIEDVAKRMDAVVHERIDSGALAAPFDMIVHSTGGLVARQWLTDYYPSGGSPIRRLIMLAPANHGSPLAAKGKSLIGRIAKGWNNWFETGAEMLDALELASPYQWSLVQKDLLARAEGAGSPYGTAADKVLPFVITGTHPYASGARRLVDENGGDGTVRVPAANMNTRGLTIDFSQQSDEPVIETWYPRHEFERMPFAVLPDRNHATVTDPMNPGASLDSADQRHLGELILKSLGTDTEGYEALAEDWFQLSERTAGLANDTTARENYFGDDRSEDYFHQYVQLVMRVTDDHGNEVGDYFVEFSDGAGGEARDAAEAFHTEVLESVKPNSKNPSYRCFFIDRTDLLNLYYPMIGDAVMRQVLMSISAAPPGGNVSYFGGDTHSAQGTVTAHTEAEATRWLRRNQTHYVEIIIPRTPSDGVFRMSQDDEPFTA